MGKLIKKAERLPDSCLLQLTKGTHSA